MVGLVVLMDLFMSLLRKRVELGFLLVTILYCYDRVTFTLTLNREQTVVRSGEVLKITDHVSRLQQPHDSFQSFLFDVCIDCPVRTSSE